MPAEPSSADWPGGGPAAAPPLGPSTAARTSPARSGRLRATLLHRAIRRPSRCRAPSRQPTQSPPASARLLLETGHDLGGEEPHALEDLLLREDLDGIQKEVDAVDADRLPPLDRGGDQIRVTDDDPFGDAVLGTRARRVDPRPGSEVPERLVRPCRNRLPRPEQVRVGESEQA